MEELSIEVEKKPKHPAPTWQQGEVIEVIEETPDTNTLRIRLEHSIGFLPGQYYNIRIPVEGRPRPIQRAYSVGSSPFPDANVIDVGIKETPGGLVSPRLVRDSAPGQFLEVRGPYGAFTWTEERDGPLLLIGAGSGVVPLMSMIRYASLRELEVQMHLLFSSKSYEYVIYSEELGELESRHSWLEVSHSFTRDREDSRARFHRRVDKEMVAETFEDISPEIAYICGPPEMVEECEKILENLGMDRSKILSEKYD